MSSRYDPEGMNNEEKLCQLLKSMIVWQCSDGTPSHLPRLKSFWILRICCWLYELKKQPPGADMSSHNSNPPVFLWGWSIVWMNDRSIDVMIEFVPWVCICMYWAEMESNLLVWEAVAVMMWLTQLLYWCCSALTSNTVISRTSLHLCVQQRYVHRKMVFSYPDALQRIAWDYAFSFLLTGLRDPRPWPLPPVAVCSLMSLKANPERELFHMQERHLYRANAAS